MIDELSARDAYACWLVANYDNKICHFAKESKQAYINFRDSVPFPGTRFSKAKAFDCQELGWQGDELVSYIAYRHTLRKLETYNLERDAQFIMRVYNKAIFSKVDPGDIEDFVPIGYDFETSDELYTPKAE